MDRTMYDGGFAINPPTLCQIGKRAPASTLQSPAGQQGVHGGGRLRSGQCAVYPAGAARSERTPPRARAQVRRAGAVAHRVFDCAFTVRPSCWPAVSPPVLAVLFFVEGALLPSG
jgi:hypothetical protein